MLVGTIILVVGGIWIFSLGYLPRRTPAIAVSVLSYTKVNYTDPNVFAGKWIRAEVVITNEGTTTVSYPSWGPYPAWVGGRRDIDRLDQSAYSATLHR